MTGTRRSRRAGNSKQEQFARVEADKGLHRFFTALHRKHEKIWGAVDYGTHQKKRSCLSRLP